MTAVAVIPVAFRLIDEQLMVWVQPRTHDPSQIHGHGGRRADGPPHGHPDGEAWGLPQTEIGDQESNHQALERLIDGLPFAHDVARVKHCAVFAEPNRVAGRREIALISWVLVRPTAHHEAAAYLQASQLQAVGGHAPGTNGLNGTYPSPAAEPANGSARAATLAAPVAAPAAASEGWFPVDHLPVLVHDHAAIIASADRHLSAEVLHDAVTRRVLPRHLLRSAVDELVLQSDQEHHPPALFGLLPDPFPLSAIRRFYERLLGTDIDRGNFRRKLVELRPTGMLKELPIFQRGVRHRAAQLFTFDARAWERWAATDEPE